jgi:mannosyltransferase
MVAAIVALGAAIRFATIASQSYWVDEATTVRELHLSFGGMLHAVATNESTPPLYYALAWVWAKVFGTGAVALRSLSALAGVAVIPVVYLAGRELGSRRAGVYASLLAALSPLLIWYSQEARAYMLFTLLCALSFLFFARALREPTARNLGWWAACSSLAALTHFFAGFLVAPEAIWLVAKHRNRPTLLAAVVVAMVQAALIPLVVGDLGHPLLGWIKQFPLSIRIEQVPVALGLGTLYLSPLVSGGLIAAALLALVVALLVVFGADPRERSGAVAAAVVATCTIFVPLILAAAGRDYYIARNLIGAWVPLAVLLAIACTALRSLPAGAALGALLAGAFVIAQVKIDSTARYQRPDWQGVAAALGHPTGARAVVAYDGPYASGPLLIYLPRSSLWGGAALSVDEVDVVGNTYQTLAKSLPAGIRVIATRTVDQFLVTRFALPQGREINPAEVAPSLLGPEPSGVGVVLVQRAG